MEKWTVNESRGEKKKKGNLVEHVRVERLHLSQSFGKRNALTKRHWRNIGEMLPCCCSGNSDLEPPMCEVLLGPVAVNPDPGAQLSLQGPGSLY